jgi:dimethylaniline monooxygenase (N-oxide forming)
MDSVIIIGFGVSGIASCRWALHFGFIPIVLETETTFGGCWLNKTYPGLKLQTTRYNYAFSDMEFTDSVSIYPTAGEVLNYLEKYIITYDLNKYVQYNSKVTHINYVDNMWHISYLLNNKKLDTKIAKYLIICSGFYTNTKNSIKKYVGHYYATDFKSLDHLKTVVIDKSVSVIGNGSTGIDMACFSVKNGAKTCRIFYKSPRFVVPRYFYGLSLHFLTMRIFLFIGKYISGFFCRLIILILGYVPYFSYLNKIKLPPENVNRYNIVINDDFYNLVIENHIDYINENVLEILNNGVRTTGGIYNSDVVIECVGYKNDISFLNLDNIPKLYKHILYPTMENMGFVGYCTSFNWCMVSDLQARWLFQYFKRKEKLSIYEINQWIGKYNINNKDYHDIAYSVYDYCDDLYLDIINSKHHIAPLSTYYSIVKYNTWRT